MCIALPNPETSTSQDKKSEHCSKPHVEDDQQICETAETGDFDCNICLDSPQDPVVTLCGHLFCWPCLYRWLESHSTTKECPVCKAHVDEKRVIPLYGIRGRTRQSDPRKKAALGITIPARPQGSRCEHSPQAVATGLRSRGSSPRIHHVNPHGGGYNHHLAFSPGFALSPSSLGSVQMTGLPYGHYGFSGTGYSTAIATQGDMFHSRMSYVQPQQEAFLLHCLFILLACFAMACLLFF